MMRGKGAQGRGGPARGRGGARGGRPQGKGGKGQWVPNQVPPQVVQAPAEPQAVPTLKGYEMWGQNGRFGAIWAPNPKHLQGEGARPAAYMEVVRRNGACTWRAAVEVTDEILLPDLLGRFAEFGPGVIPDRQMPHMPQAPYTVERLCEEFGLNFAVHNWLDGSIQATLQDNRKGILLVTGPNEEDFDLSPDPRRCTKHALGFVRLRKKEVLYSVDARRNLADAMTLVGMPQVLIDTLYPEGVQVPPPPQIPWALQAPAPMLRIEPEGGEPAVVFDPAEPIYVPGHMCECAPLCRACDRVQRHACVVEGDGLPFFEAEVHPCIFCEQRGRLEVLEAQERYAILVEEDGEFLQHIDEVLRARALLVPVGRLNLKWGQSRKPAKPIVDHADVFFGPSMPPAGRKKVALWVGPGGTEHCSGRAVRVGEWHLSPFTFTGIYHRVMVALGHRQVAYEATKSNLIGRRVWPGVLLYSLVDEEAILNPRHEYARDRLRLDSIVALQCEGATYRLGDPERKRVGGRDYDVAEVLPAQEKTGYQSVRDAVLPESGRVVTGVAITVHPLKFRLAQLGMIPHKEARVRAANHLLKRYTPAHLQGVMQDVRNAMFTEGMDCESMEPLAALQGLAELDALLASTGSAAMPMAA